MNEQNYILCAYEFTASGQGIPLTGEDIDKKVRSHKPTWVHLDAKAQETREWLRHNVDYLDELTINSLLEEETRPRLHESRDGIMIIMRGVNLHKGAEPEDMISIRLWIDKNRIITTERRAMVAVSDIKNLLDIGKGPKNSVEFLIHLSTRILVHMEEVLIELNDNTDKIEEEAINNANSVSRFIINDIRREALILRRYFAPQKDVISTLIVSSIEWIEQHHKRHLYENLDRITRYIEDLDIIRERAQMVKEEIAHAVASRMNKNMYVLSIVSSIFMPMSFFTGLLGSNIGGIPGSNFDYAFWIVSGACATFALGMLAFFKRKKWI